MILDDVLSALEELADDRYETVVLYAALWPLLRLVDKPGPVIAAELSERIQEKLSGRTLLMPAFTSGFNEQGVCDLDSLPSQTGVLSEMFRRSPGVRRTRSAFFSFAVSGPNAATLISLEPEEAWGEGSVYEWLHSHDAAIMTLGLHPTHCSYTHYGEWLARQQIPYRFNKIFSGSLLHEHVATTHSETLLVRQRNPEPINDFTWLLPAYLSGGMQVCQPHGFVLSCISARAKMTIISKSLRKSPLALIRNKEEFSNHVR